MTVKGNPETGNAVAVSLHVVERGSLYTGDEYRFRKKGIRTNLNRGK